MLLHNASRRQESEKATDSFTYYRDTCEASVPSTRDHENLARTFCLLHSQPPFGTLYRVRRVRHRRPKVQRPGPTEAKLVERVLERTTDHASLANG